MHEKVKHARFCKDSNQTILETISLNMAGKSGLVKRQNTRFKTTTIHCDDLG